MLKRLTLRTTWFSLVVLLLLVAAGCSNGSY